MIDAKSLSKVFVYNYYKELQANFPSVKTFAKLIKANSVSVHKVIENGMLFRGGWYITKTPLNTNIGNIDHATPVYSSYIYPLIKRQSREIKNNSAIKQPIFVFDLDGIYLRKYNGIVEAEENLKIRHEATNSGN
jgi:hypothetical protein